MRTFQHLLNMLLVLQPAVEDVSALSAVEYLGTSLQVKLAIVGLVS